MAWCTGFTKAVHNCPTSSEHYKAIMGQTISQIERGDYSPSVTLALKLAKLCGVTVEDIFSYEEDGEHENQAEK